MRQIPEKLINFSAYLNGNEYLGAADLTLPNLESMTETLSGAGIAGEVDSPTLGHFSSMTTTINWRTVDRSAIRLLGQKSHAIDFRGSHQLYNSATGEYRPSGIRVTMKVMSKTGTLGNFAPASPTETSNEFEVSYIKIFMDGQEVLELDKFNFIFRVEGTDYLAEVRQQLGM
ncbi:phage major tail tube protein [Paenibacillus tyrfis]|uniref:Tail protein n=1 Tax=Paenibacillus tyrfis TaxID=1501230 RepID=A0A081NV34_9BACL|nr:phage major tail tube protein [Paenibacillus tyrfis]KEQ22307.1 tail protein [Paenibacillus tyrfis]